MIRIIQGISVDVAATLMIMLLNLVSIPFFVEHFGIESYGLWLTLSSIVSAVGICDISADQHLMKMAADNSFFKSDRWQAYTVRIMIIKLVFCCLFLGFVYFGYRFFIHKFYESSSNSDVIISIVSLCAVSYIINIINGFYNSILYSRGFHVITNSINGIAQGLSIVFPLMFLMLNLNIIAMALGAVISSAITLLINSIIYYKKGLNKTDEKNRQACSEITYTDIFQYIYKFHVLKVLFLLRNNGFPILLSIFVSLEFVAFYNISIRVPQMMVALLSKINTPFLPLWANLISQNKQETLRNEVFFLSCIQSLFGMIMFTGLYLFLPIFINLWTGLILEDTNLLIGICIYFSLQIITSPYYHVAHASGDYGKSQLLAILEVLIFIVLFYLLVNPFNGVGALYALTLSSLVTQVYFLKCSISYLSISVGFYMACLLKKLAIFVSFLFCWVYLSSWTDLVKYDNDTTVNFFISLLLFSLYSFSPLIFSMWIKKCNLLTELKERFMLTQV